MANTFTEKIKIKLDGANKAAKGTNKVSKGMNSLAKSAMAAGAAYFGARGIINGLKESISLFQQQELAEKKLEIALGGTSEALLSQATALQKSTMFGDEAIIEAQALIAAFVDEEEAIAAATVATLDLAAAKGMDLVTAADLVSKTLGSSTNALSRYGIQVEGAVGSTERLDSLTGNLAKVFGGQATEQTKTLAGSMEQMNNAIGDMKEKIGEALAPVIIDLANFFGHAADSVGSFFQSFNETLVERQIRQLRELGGSEELILKIESQMYRNRREEILKTIDDERTYDELIKDRAVYEKLLIEQHELRAQAIINLENEGRANAKTIANETVHMNFNITALESNLDKIDELIETKGELLVTTDLYTLSQLKLTSGIYDATDAITTQNEEFRKSFLGSIDFVEGINIISDSALSLKYRMQDAFNDIIVYSQKSSKELAKAGISMGVSAEKTSDAVTQASTAFIAANWEYILGVIYALEKIVKMTPTKYDDILFDMLLKPIKEKFAPSKK